MQFVLATRNAKKAEELQRILAELSLEIQILTIDKFPDAPEVEETQATFVGNALLKARALCQFTGLPAIADDSGLCVAALNGDPGVLSARWSGASENVDQANLELVLKQVADATTTNRDANFTCAAVAVFPDNTELVAIGIMTGTLLAAPVGENGFGYDPIFVPTGYTKSTAQLLPAEKDVISHRGKALLDLANQIASYISKT
jgi:XTP/dITP diphosphohydrolase